MCILILNLISCQDPRQRVLGCLEFPDAHRELPLCNQDDFEPALRCVTRNHYRSKIENADHNVSVSSCLPETIHRATVQLHYPNYDLTALLPDAENFYNSIIELDNNWSAVFTNPNDLSIKVTDAVSTEANVFAVVELSDLMSGTRRVFLVNFEIDFNLMRINEGHPIVINQIKPLIPANELIDYDNALIHAGNVVLARGKNAANHIIVTSLENNTVYFYTFELQANERISQDFQKIQGPTSNEERQITSPDHLISMDFANKDAQAWIVASFDTEKDDNPERAELVTDTKLLVHLIRDEESGNFVYAEDTHMRMCLDIRKTFQKATTTEFTALAGVDLDFHRASLNCSKFGIGNSELIASDSSIIGNLHAYQYDEDLLEEIIMNNNIVDYVHTYSDQVSDQNFDGAFTLSGNRYNENMGLSIKSVYIPMDEIQLLFIAYPLEENEPRPSELLGEYSYLSYAYFDSNLSRVIIYTGRTTSYAIGLPDGHEGFYVTNIEYRLDEISFIEFDPTTLSGYAVLNTQFENGAWKFQFGAGVLPE